MKSKTWVKTAVPNLYSHSNSGIYYARIYLDGKNTFRSLKTKTFSVAKPRLRKMLADLPSRRKLASAASDPTLADLLTARRAEIGNSAKLKPRTKGYYLECLDVIQRTFPKVGKTPARLISVADCQSWGATLAEEYSATRFNNTVGELRRLFSIGIREEWLDRNPALSVDKKTPRPKDLDLPSQEDFHLLVSEIRQAGGRFSVACANLIEFLAYSGCRVGESAFVTWADCDFVKGILLVRGDPDGGPKSGNVRRVPMNPSLRTLLERLRPASPPESTPVMLVRECQKSVDRACKRLGIARLTHHDFRHFFATRCIEAGVDIPTVANWLGHKDGGALAMKTYGHLRQEHSLEQAKKVVF